MASGPKDPNAEGRDGGSGEDLSAVHALLVRKMDTIAPLTAKDRDGLRAITGTLMALRPSQDVVQEGDRPDSMCMVVEGFLCRYKILEDGRRQIMAFHIPGDTPDSLSLFVRRMDHNLGTLVPSTVMQISHKMMFDVFDRYPNLVSLFWRDTLIDAAVFREWMVGLGRREAYPRMARMLCEVMTRMTVMGFSDGRTCELPLTQAEIADATGLSTVHVNRVLQELRGNGLINFRGGSLTVLDWRGLQRAGQFDPAYLHLNEAVAS